MAGAVLSDSSGTLADAGIDRVESLLDGMSEDELEGARKVLNDLNNRVEVRSVGRLSAEQVDRLKKALREKLGAGDIEIEAKEDASLLAGLEVTLGHINLRAHWRSVIDEALQKRRDDTQPAAGDTR